MKSKTFILGCFFSLAIFLFAQRRQPLHEQSGFKAVVDLTHSISSKSPNWEGTEKSPYEARQLGNIDKDHYFSREIRLPEHFSTHIDAPAHFRKGAWTVDQIPPERLIGPLVILNVTPASKDPEYQVSMEDVARWEQAHGHIPPGAIVMARTGWASRWDSMKQYRNADAKGVMHFPGFALQTVKFLVESRSVSGLGIDTMSVDPGASSDFPAHQYTMGHNVYHLENVADMAMVPESGAVAVVSPAKLEGGSGGPVRIFALIR